MSMDKGRFKGLAILLLSIAMLGLTGCSIRTPTIHGMVLDAETKEPVEGAWVTADVEIETNTVAGTVTTVWSVAPPHLRTGKDGRFVIPSKRIKKSLPPRGFGTKVKSLGVSAHTADWRGGGLELKEKAGNRKTEVTILIKSAVKEDEKQVIAYQNEGITKERALELIELEYFATLQSLYTYCRTGRLGVARPSVKDGCDAWELDYVITKHEWFLERLGEPKNIDQRVHYRGTMSQLGYLYRRKGDYKKALSIFKTVLAYDKKTKMDLNFREYERQIKELEGLLKK